MVRCADKATSEKVKSNSISTMIFFDGDGREFHRTTVSTVSTVEDAYKKALELYARRPISWSSGEPSDVISQAPRDRKKLVALAFLDGRKDSDSLISSLEDRWVAKYQDRLVFSKVAFNRSSEMCKKYNVTTAPSLLLINAAEDDPRKSIIDQLVAKKELVSVHAFLTKAFDRFDRGPKN